MSVRRGIRKESDEAAPGVSWPPSTELNIETNCGRGGSKKAKVS